VSEFTQSAAAMLGKVATFVLIARRLGAKHSPVTLTDSGVEFFVAPSNDLRAQATALIGMCSFEQSITGEVSVSEDIRSVMLAFGHEAGVTSQEEFNELIDEIEADARRIAGRWPEAEFAACIATLIDKGRIEGTLDA
jgi:hypothetical protein